jgi:hypothetical protein
MNRYQWVFRGVLITGLLFLPLAAIAQQQPSTAAPVQAPPSSMAQPAQAPPSPMAKPAQTPQAPMAKPAEPAGLSGKITAIDMAANTVVVDVPMGKQMFTVGGPLAPMAKLTKAGKPAKLSDFKQGDHVKVSYKSTAKGPVIEKLMTQ